MPSLSSYQSTLRIVALLGVLRFTTSTVSTVSAAETAPAGMEFFEKRIRPVLVQHCYECHSKDGRKKRQGGLLLDSRAGIRRGGDSGAAVVPGKVDESLIIGALRHDDFEMPPKGRLPKSVISDFVKWIRIGAPDPREGGDLSAEDSTSTVFEKTRDYWSFQPIKRPVVSNDADSDSPIDQLIDAALAQRSLNTAGEASKATLLRRLTFDLTGLPPTPEELEAFLGDSNPDAYARVVDRLLKSHQFGERFARRWLDVVRFSESSGGGRTRIFEHAWRYRDYVINSFAADKPFDRFILEQIAGDLLPFESVAEGEANLTATSMLALGAINYELQDKELLDMEVVDEQLTVICKTFLGMTVDCARCHDHKFDPIPTRDYYALAGIFTSTKSLNHANVSNPVMREIPVGETIRKQIAEFAELTGPIRKRIQKSENELKRLDRESGKRTGNSIPLKLLAGHVLDEVDAERVGEWKSSTSVAGYVGDSYHFSESPEAEVRYEIPLKSAGEREVRIAYTASGNRASNVQISVWHAGEETTRTVNMKDKPGIDGSFVSLGTFRFEDRARIVVRCRGANGVVIADAVQLLPAGGDKPVAGFVNAENSERNDAEDLKRKQQRTELDSELKKLRAELAALEKQAPAPVPVVMSIEDAKEVGDCNLCIRGNVHNPGAKVPRGFLSVVTGGEAAKIPAGTSGRLEFARWIGSRDNPLTARVMANRVWYWLFGTGIVRSTSNFGTAGELPSHPRLLDWLADEFSANGWSVRNLVRTIVMSRTYRRAGTPPSDAKQHDPENRFLAWFPKKRLDAEAIRDAILATSGQLDPVPGGSTIRPGSKSEFGYSFNDPQLDGRRRSVYVPVFRNTLLDLFDVFDFADPNLSIGTRSTSTRPTQGLYLMNSPWVMEQAGHAAQRLLDHDELTTEQRIEYVHRLFFGRSPTPGERNVAQSFLQTDDGREPDLAAWTQLCQALYASLDFRYVR